MKANKVILLALLALAFGVQAAEISSREAAVAARNWAAQGRHFGDLCRATVRDVVRHTTDTGAAFYAVRMNGGGTVITSSDTETEPIIAFIPGSSASVEKGSPLWALLSRDLAVRARKTSAAPRRWAALAVSSEAAAGPSGLAVSPVASEAGLDDLRVAPMLKTKWNQDVAYTAARDDAKIDCFNACTPEINVWRYDSEGEPTNKTVERAACGCVATAMAQVLRHWLVAPATPVSFTGSCSVETYLDLFYGEDGELESYEDYVVNYELPSSGVVYDWANMPEEPLAKYEDGTWHGAPVSAAECQAIGRLTYDCGVAVDMEYAHAEIGSGIPTYAVSAIPSAFRELFGYESACVSHDTAGLTDTPAAREKTILANLDAGFPVILLIVDGTADGHAVVGDGYGFSGGAATPYVHLNMGWSGQCDVWYNLPEVNTAGNPEDFEGFDTIDGVVYNLFPTNSGEIVSGRVLDAAGEPVAGVTVAALADGVPAATAVSSASGVYALLVPAGSAYLLRAEGAAGTVAEVETATIAASDGAAAGNVWGVDLRLGQPCVRIGDKGYASLEHALDDAGRLGGSPTVEVLAPVEVGSVRTLDAGLTLTAATADPSAAAVTFGAGAGLTVAAGARVLFTGIVFTGANKAPVRVLAGGTAAFAGTAEVGTVEVADKAGVELAGALANGIVVKCLATSEQGLVFGSVTAAEADVGESAALFVNYYDDEAGGVADFAAGTLSWGLADTPVEAAVAKLELGGETTYYRSLRTLFAAVTADATVTLFSDCELTNSVTLAHALKIVSDVNGAGAPFEIACGKSVTIGIAESGSLELGNVTLSRAAGKSESFITVDGGSLTLGEGATIERVSTSAGAPVKVVTGTVSMQAGSAITGCESTGSSASATAGAVYLRGSGAVLDLCGGEIVGNATKPATGAVLAGLGSTVRVSGAGSVYGNVRTGSTAAANLCLAGPKLQVAGRCTGRFGIVKTSANEAGDAFADIAGASAPDVTASLGCFSNDEHPTYTAAVSGSTLVWSTVSSELPRPVPQAMADVRLIAGGSTNCYATFADALAVSGGSARIELLRDAVIADEVTVSGSVVFAGGGHVMRRADGNARIVVPSGASLTVAGLDFDASAPDALAPFYVSGGSLTLDSGTVIRGQTGAGFRAAGGVVVDGGTFVLNPGATVRDCTNSYVHPSNETGVGGGVLVDNHATAYLNGGTVTGCSASRAGGVCIANESTVYVKGPLDVTGNTTLGGEPADLMVADYRSRLVLTAPMTGAVGFVEGIFADTNVFGSVSASFSGSNDELVDSARRFTRNANGDFGAVGSGDEADLLIWNSAFDRSAEYTAADGEVYTYVDGGEPVEVEPPAAVTGLVYTGLEQSGLEPTLFCFLDDAVKVNAGSYVARVTPRAGCVWSDGTAAAKSVSWSIARAPVEVTALDASKAEGAAEPTLAYTVTGLVNGEQAADVFTGALSRASGETEGEYAITRGTLAVKSPVNYDIVSFTGAVFTITGSDGPGPERTPGEPLPIAFKSITRIGEGEWRLVVTNCVPYCWYRLLSTEDLAAGFTVTGAWTQAGADAPLAWTTVVESESDAKFWRAEVKPGEVPSGN